MRDLILEFMHHFEINKGKPPKVRDIVEFLDIFEYTNREIINCLKKENLIESKKDIR